MRSAFFMQPFCSIEKISTFAPLLENRATQRELSSAGSEHLPYKQRVIGSNPIAPTERRVGIPTTLFLYLLISLSEIIPMSI